MFKTIKNKQCNSVELFKEKRDEIIALQNRIREWKEKAKIIQSQFDFYVPEYVMDEIIEKGDSIYHNYDNLYCLINCAVLNKRISPKNANKIKEPY